MRKQQFSPTVEGSALEPRVALTLGGARAALFRALAPANNGIQFVVAPQGVSQSAINFTTLRASQILHGNGNGPGIYRSFQNFNRTGNVAQLNANLSNLAVQIPYGRQELLPLWQDDISGLSSQVRDKGHVAQKFVLQDYVGYLKDGIGTTFNYLKSNGHRNEFAIPTNGHV